jgi:hypothetical protein
MTQCGSQFRAAVEIRMRASVMMFAVFAATVVGCGHAEQQRQAQEYERFLKSSFGTVEADAPLVARAGSASGHVAD